jgi:hypothetical protein
MKKKPTRKKGRTRGSRSNPKPKAKKKARKRGVSTKALAEMDIEFETLLSELLPRQKEFLLAFYEEGTIAEAARKIGISRQAHHDVWMKKDEHQNYIYGLYAQLFLDARAALVEIAEAALWRRGVKGISEPVFHQGKKTEHKIIKYDTTALIFWLKGNCPQKYKERFEHTGEGGGPMQMTIDAARQIADNYDRNQALLEAGES